MKSLDVFRHALTLPSPLVPFEPDWPGAEKVSLYVKRDDAIHPVMSGNKWRKLSPVFKRDIPREIVSFGGGYSNHLHALGYACHQLNIPLTAVIRGNYTANPTPMIVDLMRWGIRICYVDRDTYKKRHDSHYLSELQQRYPDALLIPEGGSQQIALEGVSELVREIDIHVDHLIAPVASGATLAGIAAALNAQTLSSPLQPNPASAIGIGVLKGEGYLESLVENLLPITLDNWHIQHEYHMGGYAKVPHALREFCQQFNETMPFSIEPVYSGKVFWAVKDMLAKSTFEPGAQIVILHTGGLQGAR
ncbi:pyridoxal-phosphate dependent enzyme [Alteromonas sp. D210916BOD_24]|uniref:1-aminocyclopropane-1-carboxylate deaminase/D-cysteine desulfhydrase n=1 Tax=Alteromonas sp. D210916BOD_24 TaxID=3157618 RepID=UPI00399CA693